jgi:CRP-like cAMP-binding protein
MLRRCAILKDAPAAVLDELAKKSKVEPRHRGRILFRAGDVSETVLLVVEGRVRLSRSSGDDREYLVSWRDPAELVADAMLCGSPAERETAEVAQDAVLLAMPLRTVRKVTESDAATTSRLLQSVARRKWDHEDYVERLLFHTVEARLAERFLALAAQYGQPDPRGTLIGLKVTHAELSRAIGATRETVTLTLGALRRRGLIDFDRRRIVVKDGARLGKLV